MKKYCNVDICQSGLQATVCVDEVVGDGAFKTFLCEQCAAVLNVQDRSRLVDHHTNRQLLEQYWNVDQTEDPFAS